MGGIVTVAPVTTIFADDKPDIVQQIIDEATKVLRKYFPEPCSTEDAQRQSEGLPPHGPTGLTYIARRLQVLATQTLTAAASGKHKVLRGVVTTVHEDRFTVELAQALEREIEVVDAIRAISERANLLPFAEQEDGPGIITVRNEIMNTVRRLLWHEESLREERRPDVVAFSDFLERLVSAETDFDTTQEPADEYSAKRYDVDGYEVVG
jgi:hypothetical protein